MGDEIIYVDYEDESVLKDIQSLVSKDLSEPYSIYTYRYFLHQWPGLCVCAYAREGGSASSSSAVPYVESRIDNDVLKYSSESVAGSEIPLNERGKMVGTILCKAERERGETFKGYIAMLTVDDKYRKRGIGVKLARIGICRMFELGCEEIALEAEATNVGALSLYEKLGFMRDELLCRYYLNGSDAYRLRLWSDKIGQFAGFDFDKADENDYDGKKRDILSLENILK